MLQIIHFFAVTNQALTSLTINDDFRECFVYKFWKPAKITNYPSQKRSCQILTTRSAIDQSENDGLSESSIKMLNQQPEESGVNLNDLPVLPFEKFGRHLSLEDCINDRLKRMVQNYQQLSIEKSMLFGSFECIHLPKELIGERCIRPELHLLHPIRVILRRVQPVDSRQPRATPPV